MKEKLPFAYHSERWEKVVSLHSFLTLDVNGQLHAPVEESPVSTEQKAYGLYRHFGDENTFWTRPESNGDSQSSSP
jgi:hypothetical protein